MEAIVLRELGDAENLRLSTAPDPRAEAGEVVVRLAAAALNHRDVWIRRGLYPGIKLPAIMGSDGAGVIASVGPSVDPSMIGREVVINPSLNWGGSERVQSAGYRILGVPDDGTYAQQVRVPVANVYAKPPTLSFAESAALPLAGVTAYRAVVTRARVKPGERVLITGIGGGVAAFALQIATALGAHVFVTSGSDEKLSRARALGAADGVNYHDPSWPAAIKSATDGGPDVVIDSVGGDTFAQAIDVVRPGGRVVSYGATKGASQVEVRRIFFKQLDVLGSTMGTAHDFEQMLELYGSGRLHPPVDRVFPLAASADAHRRMEGGQQFGKIVLNIE